ncbi:MAG: hypothetical protein K5984_02285 [Bacteroidales bacterium]|nr:hypothetical protein [Bacteroidales bacterium]
MRKTVLLFLIALIPSLFPSLCYSQPYMKKIKVKEEIYVHSKTGFEFPKEIGSFNRGFVVAFDKGKENIGVTYDGGSTQATVYVSKSDFSYEDRLKDQFFEKLRSIMYVWNTNPIDGLKVDISCISMPSGKYNLQGLSGKFAANDKQSLISMYECGHWMFQIRISDSNLETNLDSLEVQLRSAFNPECLVSSNPLGEKIQMNVQPAALADSLLTVSVMAQALAKIAWVQNNVDPVQLQAGIPSMNLEYQLYGIEGALAFALEDRVSSSESTRAMIGYLKAVKKAGYLEEMLSERRNGCIIIPEGTVLDYDGYHKWAKDHPYNGNLLDGYAPLSNE